jgi:uncharacterized membrane protein YphA (DoxX/SURF4 family)
LLTEGFEAAVGQHYLWGLGLLVLAVFGPGKVSLDELLKLMGREPSMASQAKARVA